MSLYLLVWHIELVHARRIETIKKKSTSKTIIPSHNFILFIDHLSNAIELGIERERVCTFDAYHLTECYHRYKLESLHGTTKRH